MNVLPRWSVGMALLAGASVAYSQAWESVYLPLHDQERCVQVQRGEQGMEAVFQCKGPNGFPYQWSSGDDRLFLSFGEQADAEKAAGQTLLPFNYAVDDARIEWLFGPGTVARSMPSAAVLRFMLAADDERGIPGQVLVAYQIQPGQSCQIAYVDARANREANTLIREAVHAQADSFDCSQEPRIVGDWKAYPIEPQTQTEQGLTLHMLANGEGRYLDGAGCYYTAPDHRVVFDEPATWQYLFIGDIYDTRRAWAGVDGDTHVLDLVTDPTGEQIRPGQLHKWEYRGGEVNAMLDMTVTGAEPGYWRERGTLTVQRAGARTVMEVTGECGS